VNTVIVMDLKQQVLLFVQLQTADMAPEKRVELFRERTGSTSHTYFGWLQKWRQLDVGWAHDERVKRFQDWIGSWVH